MGCIKRSTGEDDHNTAAAQGPELCFGLVCSIGPPFSTLAVHMADQECQLTSS
jgi:hypothetical protein